MQCTRECRMTGRQPRDDACATGLFGQVTVKDATGVSEVQVNECTNRKVIRTHICEEL
jgi:hypothetical protein